MRIIKCCKEARPFIEHCDVIQGEIEFYTFDGSAYIQDVKFCPCCGKKFEVEEGEEE